MTACYGSNRFKKPRVAQDDGSELVAVRVSRAAVVHAPRHSLLDHLRGGLTLLWGKRGK